MKTRLIPALVLGLFWLPGLTSINRAQTSVTDDPAAIQTLPKLTLHLGKATLNTEIAATEEQRERGLMFRTKLGDNDAMIFLMPNIAPATFWMKNTLIPLSVAFLDKDGVILEIHDMQPMDETVTRSVSDQVAFALETNQHWFTLNQIKPGDKIDPPPSAWVKTAFPPQ